MRNQEKNGNTPVQGVIPAVAQFFSRYDKDQILSAPAAVQEMFNELMGLEHVYAFEVRQRWLLALMLISDFGTSLANVPEKDIEHFVETYHV